MYFDVVVPSLWLRPAAAVATAANKPSERNPVRFVELKDDSYFSNAFGGSGVEMEVMEVVYVRID